MTTKQLLKIDGLKRYFPVTKGMVLQKVIGHVKAVDDISFVVNEGETFSLVGESGCGKSTTANLVLKLDDPTAGDLYFNGEKITGMNGPGLQNYRRSLQAVFQDPFRSLNPRRKVKAIIAQPLEAQKIGTKQSRAKKVAELMDIVGLRPRQAELYPHEFSGGQRQRIAIARALVLDPKALVLDEPVSALDVSIQAQILNLLKDLQTMFGLTYLMISHDLAVVDHMSTNIGVMYLGSLVEVAPRKELFNNTKHPYTRALLDSVPVADPSIKMKATVEGEVPSPINLPSGCRFHPRCPLAEEKCLKENPKSREVGPNHFAACHLV
ncbi:MAG: ATP-binding cassette domain-containing protein [Deltaproteobacteria bacterium]|nr:ATP-binding cassette domain-containing protein [Deltaproteobacteria bacterium]MBT4637903.1 ATP-binding cassette domain-containing protein [Deltaproteobacteria bacterium]MBT6500974.1 ATP-binding cassette domain-containing protein [Deltaproteobacteria bacterium]MBT7711322.1 ATP-binding cassette domain-containing protein [Deltaproteobacteria bacterium]MBT7888236.1 ATP-binding cassette domain-containing protein [Deltaproteobacteria bacterium]